MFRSRYAVAALIIGALAALISNLPLSWVGPLFTPKNLKASASYSGTIWKGRAQFKVGEIGFPLTFSISPKKLLSGKQFVNFQIRNQGLNLSGFSGFRQADTIAILGNIQFMPLKDPRIRGLKGRIKAQIDTVKLTKACTEISGTIETDFLQANSQIWFWTGPKLSGPIKCEGEDIFMQLSGQDDRQSFTLTLRLKPDGNYRLEARAQSSLPRAATVLQFYGFETDGSDLLLIEQGQWY